MTDNLVAAMKPEIRFKCRNLKKEDIKNILRIMERGWRKKLHFFSRQQKKCRLDYSTLVDGTCKVSTCCKASRN
jgi:hypothetical protein